MADMMSPAKQSALVSRIRSKNTRIETTVFRELRARGVHFSRHVASLSGSPDVVFKRERVAVFIDGDFWHGWRFSRWCEKLRPILERQDSQEPGEKLPQLSQAAA